MNSDSKATTNAAPQSPKVNEMPTQSIVPSFRRSVHIFTDPKSMMVIEGAVTVGGRKSSRSGRAGTTPTRSTKHAGAANVLARTNTCFHSLSANKPLRPILKPVLRVVFHSTHKNVVSQNSSHEGGRSRQSDTPKKPIDDNQALVRYAAQSIAIHFAHRPCLFSQQRPTLSIFSSKRSRRRQR